MNVEEERARPNAMRDWQLLFSLLFNGRMVPGDWSGAGGIKTIGWNGSEKKSSFFLLWDYCR